MEPRKLTPIAHIQTPYKDKFGVPRQSGMVENILSKIEFVPEFRSVDAVRGLIEFSHIWVLWEFSGFDSDKWSPTVRPPRLGGNTRMGVFATRSPNRPNSIGLSSLRLVDIDMSSANAPILTVSGADMVNGTAIYDIKPYIPFTDSHPNAASGFANAHIAHRLNVHIPAEIAKALSKEQLENIKQILSLDPRPSYHKDPKRIYGLTAFGVNIKFCVDNSDLKVTAIEQD